MRVLNTTTKKTLTTWFVPKSAREKGNRKSTVKSYISLTYSTMTPNFNKIYLLKQTNLHIAQFVLFQIEY